MLDTTAELALKLPEPAVSPAEVEQLVAVLREAGDWRTARELAAALGEGANERSVRLVASVACPAVVSFPGSRGYKLWQLCSIEEIDHAIEAFESQGRDMLKRAVLYRQAYHKRFRGSPGTCQPAVMVGESSK